MTRQKRERKAAMKRYRFARVVPLLAALLVFAAAVCAFALFGLPDAGVPAKAALPPESDLNPFGFLPAAGLAAGAALFLLKKPAANGRRSGI